MTRSLETGARVVAGLGKAVAVGGATYAVYGVALPWAQTRLFGALPVALPGYLYALGGVALTGAACAVLLVRFPLALIACGVAVLMAAGQAQVQIPRAVRGQMIGAQIAFAPLNRLLDQFHIENVTVGNYGARDDALLGIGIGKTLLGGWLILIGGCAALPGDPLLRAAYLRFGRQRCRQCAARWPVKRAARHCPECGCSTFAGKGQCLKCGGETVPSDRFCVRCGEEQNFHTHS